MYVRKNEISFEKETQLYGYIFQSKTEQILMHR